MYPNIFREISGISWAMYPDAFSGIVRGVEGKLSFADYELFHKLDEEVKSSTLGFLGTKVAGARYSRIKGNIGSIFIDGPIIPRASGFSDVSGLTNIDTLTKEYLAFEANEEVEKILLVIDSPGGAVTGLSEFVQIISEGTKPVEAIALGLMASAAYWIGSAADKIYSVDTGLIGSIGTILSMPNPDDSTTVIVSDYSPNKNLDPTTKEGLADAKRIVNDLALIFIKSVAANRSVKEKVVLSQYGKGAVFVAEDALIRGMIDGIVSLRDYMSGAAIKTNLQAADADLDSPETGTKLDVKTKTKKQENLQMAKSLKELRAEDAGLNAEVAQLETAAYQAAVKDMQATAGRLTKYLVSTEYGNPIKQLCCRVLSGESDIAALESAVAVLDENRAQASLAAATLDTAGIEETPAGDPRTSVSEADGSIDTEADFEASLAAQRAHI
jgi:ClpP class serine protease